MQSEDYENAKKEIQELFKNLNLPEEIAINPYFKDICGLINEELQNIVFIKNNVPTFEERTIRDSLFVKEFEFNNQKNCFDGSYYSECYDISFKNVKIKIKCDDRNNLLSIYQHIKGKHFWDEKIFEWTYLYTFRIDDYIHVIRNYSEKKSNRNIVITSIFDNFQTELIQQKKEYENNELKYTETYLYNYADSVASFKNKDEQVYASVDTYLQFNMDTFSQFMTFDATRRYPFDFNQHFNRMLKENKNFSKITEEEFLSRVSGLSQNKKKILTKFLPKTVQK